MIRVLQALIIIFLLLISSSTVSASLVQINDQGRMIVKVLSKEDELALGIPVREGLQIKEVANSQTGSKAKIVMDRKDDKLIMTVTQPSGEREFDITDWKQEVVEVEERGMVKKMSIGVWEDRFKLEQNGITAVTEYPINIDPEANEFSLSTPSGSVFLSVMPQEAAEISLRSRFISKITNKLFTLSQEELGVVTYTINGERVINLFNLMDYEIPVSTHVSALTGEILLVDQPVWLKLLGFLFV